MPFGRYFSADSNLNSLIDGVAFRTSVNGSRKSIQRTSGINPIPHHRSRKGTYYRTKAPNTQKGYSVSRKGSKDLIKTSHLKSILLLNDYKHFHYDSVDLGPIFVKFASDLTLVQHQTNIDSIKWRFSVESNGKKWHINKTFGELSEFDCQLHRCVFDRRHSQLVELASFLVDSSLSEASTSITLPNTPTLRANVSITALRRELVLYANRLTRLTGSVIKCFPVLKFLELDNHGNRFIPIEQTQINTPAIAAAIVIKNFVGVNSNELSLKTGDIVSVIEMQKTSTDEAKSFWKGKLTISQKDESISSISMDGSLTDRLIKVADKETGFNAAFKVGYFPSSCVKLLTDKFDNVKPQNALTFNKEKFLLWRKLKKKARSGDKWHRNKGSLRPKFIFNALLTSSSQGKVFGVGLEEYALANGLEVPLILTRCIEVIETYGVVTGVYRQCGIESNIRRLRWEFENGTDPKELIERKFLCDIHCICSLLKQYFRQLPNPLFAYECYARLITAYKSDSYKRIDCLRQVVRQLSPPHFRTAAFLMKHLSKMSKYKSITDMNASNLAIVWAPNLIRCPPKSGDRDFHLLIGLDLHKSICHFLISHATAIFEEDISEEILSVSEAAFEEVEFLRHKEHNGLINEKCTELNVGANSVSTAFQTVVQQNEIEKSRKHPDSFSSWQKFIGLPKERTSGSYYLRKQSFDARSRQKFSQRLSSGLARSQSVDTPFHNRHSQPRCSILSALSKSIASLKVLQRIKSFKENLFPEPKKMSVDKKIILINNTTNFSPLAGLEVEKDETENGEKTEQNKEKCIEENESKKRIGFNLTKCKFSYEISGSEKEIIKTGADKSSTESLLVSRYDNVLIEGGIVAREGTLLNAHKRRHRPFSTPI